MQGFTTTRAGDMFYEIRGELQNRAPLIAIHGGPGFGSHYLEPLFQLSSVLPVVLYDQAGAGRSRRTGARRTFSVEGFVEELETLCEALHAERVCLLGHSFGGIIAGEFTLRHPARVEKLILASVSIDIPQWRQDGQRLLDALPMMTRMILREGERSGDVHSPVYAAALSEYYERYVYGLDPKSECLLRSEQSSDVLTYTTVWGPNELVVTGSIQDYTLTPRLKEVTCPTLLTCGRFDEATPEAHAIFRDQIPGSTLHIFEKSAHHPHLSEEREYLEVVGEFLAA